VPSREETVVKGATTSELPDGTETVTVTDVRAVPLEQLAADDDARHNAEQVLKALNEPSHVPVAAFQSGI
jgi:FXSXX-COOH protein